MRNNAALQARDTPDVKPRHLAMGSWRTNKRPKGSCATPSGGNGPVKGKK